MTGRCLIKSRDRNAWSLTLVLVNIVIGVAHALDLLSVFVGNLDAEFFLEPHHQLDRVKRVGPEVVNEPGIRSYFVLVHTQLVNDNLFYFLLNLWIGHSFAPLLKCKPTAMLQA